MKTSLLNSRNLLLALVIIGLRPAIIAQENTLIAETGSAEMQKQRAEDAAANQKATLARIDSQIETIEDSLEYAPDDASRDAVKARLETLKERRSDLRKTYVKAKAVELSADAKNEYAKIAAWTKRTYSEAKDGMTGKHADPFAKVEAAADPSANLALAEVQLYRLNPSPENKAEVKNALEALETEIDRLEDRAEKLPKGEARKSAEKRIEALNERHSELKRSFTKARWDSTLDELRADWAKLTD